MRLIIIFCNPLNRLLDLSEIQTDIIDNKIEKEEKPNWVSRISHTNTKRSK